jgi:hypothetical protein
MSTTGDQGDDEEEIGVGRGAGQWRHTEVLLRGHRSASFRIAHRHYDNFTYSASLDLPSVCPSE